MRKFKPILLVILLMYSCMPLPTASADSVEVCCDSGSVELYLIGPAGSGEMSPFDAALSDESEELTISDALAQQQEIASWDIDPAWSGSYPSATGDFAIDYSVENAGGVQINASVRVILGGEDTLEAQISQTLSFRLVKER